MMLYWMKDFVRSLSTITITGNFKEFYIYRISIYIYRNVYFSFFLPTIIYENYRIIVMR